jgi:K+-transporting ATPase ATPase C chain
MRHHLLTAARLLVITTLLFGVLYPLVVTGVAQAIFPFEANGQLISRQGRTVGSRIIGQRFASPRYFRPRPSAAGGGYDAAHSGGTNLGPTNRKLLDAISAALAQARRDNPEAPVPIDLVTSSASGLDPDLSPEAARFQAPRIARERHVSEADVQRLIDSLVRGRQLGFLGEPRVNVLELNLALDEQWPINE